MKRIIERLFEFRALPTAPVEEIPIHVPMPKPAYVPLSPPQSSSLVHNPQPTMTRRAATRVVASDIWILLTLYRTVILGVEKRYRAVEDVTTKGHGEKTNWKEKAKEKQRFPLVEDGENASSVFGVINDIEEEIGVSDVESDNINEEFEEYIPHRRSPPIRVPLNSPVRRVSTFFEGPYSPFVQVLTPSTTSPPLLRARARRIQQSSIFRMHYSGFGCAGY